jgi:predicted deacetylase
MRDVKFLFLSAYHEVDEARGKLGGGRHPKPDTRYNADYKSHTLSEWLFAYDEIFRINGSKLHIFLCPIFTPSEHILAALFRRLLVLF